MQAGRNICAELTHALADAVRSAGISDAPPLALMPVADESLGDYSSNVAMQLARKLGRKPIETAREIAGRFSGPADVEVAAPGFINFRILPARLLENLRATRDASWGRSSDGAGRRVNVEYVSANPTGELHVGHGRGAVTGDTLARLLAFAGFDVTREYYVNDIGKQIESLGESLLASAARLENLPTPYAVTYPVDDEARAYREAGGAIPEAASAETVAEAARFARTRILDGIVSGLRRLDISFDSFVSEASLQPEIPRIMDEYRRRGLVYDADEPETAGETRRREDSKAARHKGSMEGGTFLRTSRFGDETDRVILRRSGSPTYFTSDIAYHRGKIFRGFSTMINVWGADHGGHVKRLKAALAALDLPADALEVILCQMVRLVRGGVEVKMSKRTGTLVTLRELVDEVGADAVRFFFLMRAPSSHFDFDLDLAVKQSSDNPVFYCQYAYARTRQLLAKGEEKGLRPSEGAPDALRDACETEILRRLAGIPEILRQAALKREPHRLVEAAMNLAQSFHKYQTAGKEQEALRVVNADQRETSEARLYLVEGVGLAMKTLLSLMGVSAPQRM